MWRTAPLVLALLWLTGQRIAGAQAPPASLQALIDAAPDGATVRVPPGIYRERVVVTKPLTLDGQGRAEIRGSDIWTGWQQNGPTWQSTLSVPSFQPETGGAAYTDAFQATHPEQVFVDSEQQVQVASNPSIG